MLISSKLRSLTTKKTVGSLDHSYYERIFDVDWYIHNLGKNISRQEALHHYLHEGWQAGLSPHPLFDVTWYLLKNPDVAAAGVEPLRHYLEYGSAEGRWPNPLFDPLWYIRSYPDVAASGAEPLSHYIEFGANEFRKPHLLFDIPQCGDANSFRGGSPLSDYLHFGRPYGVAPLRLFSNDFYRSELRGADVAEDLFLHFVHSGINNGLSPNPLFDAAYYVRSNPDLPKEKANFGHYIDVGWKQGRKPNPFFFPNWYVAVYDTEGIEPLQHFWIKGRVVGLKPCPYFDSTWYAKTYSDVDGDPFVHFVRSGASQQRSPNPYFDSRWYSENYLTDGTVMSALEHYIEVGQARDLKPSKWFSPTWYRSRYQAHLSETFCQPLEHYLSLGLFSGLTATSEDEILKFSGRGPSLNPERKEITPLEISKYVRYVVGYRPIIVFFANTNPKEADPRDGYVQRLCSIDQSFGHWTRIYVSPYARKENELLLTKIDDGQYVLRIGGSDFDKSVAEYICTESFAAYAHSIFALRDRNIEKLFMLSSSRVVDIHGVVPEELELQGKLALASQMHALERDIIDGSTHILCVSQSMQKWLLKKYPSVDAQKFVVVPIALKRHITPTVPNLKRNYRPRAIYVGGIQAWQCVERVIIAVGNSKIDTLFVTQEVDSATQLIHEGGLERPIIEVCTATSEENLWNYYGKADYGYALRERSVVNYVACPTKLVEYCAAGVIPILSEAHIGDFHKLGLQYVALHDFERQRLPSAEKQQAMIIGNFRIFLSLTNLHYDGIAKLTEQIINRRATLRRSAACAK